MHLSRAGLSGYLIIAVSLISTVIVPTSVSADRQAEKKQRPFQAAPEYQHKQQKPSKHRSERPRTEKPRADKKTKRRENTFGRVDRHWHATPRQDHPVYRRYVPPRTEGPYRRYVPPRTEVPYYRDRHYRDRYYDRHKKYSDRYDRKKKIKRKPRTIIVLPSRRHNRNYIYDRPFRHSYPHYKRLHIDNRFWGWLAFTAITLHILDYLNDDQVRAHERALYIATTAEIGRVVSWRSGRVRGSVTVVWEGPSYYRRYCREFKHEIEIDDRIEIAYGTACQLPDGTWEIVR